MRSKIHQELYPDELMLETFGTLNPSSSMKSEFYHGAWQNWQENSFYYDHVEFNTYEIKNVLKALGFKDLFDFQVRQNQIRFKQASDLAVARLAGLDRKYSMT